MTSTIYKMGLLPIITKGLITPLLSGYNPVVTVVPAYEAIHRGPHNFIVITQGTGDGAHPRRGKGKFQEHPCVQKKDLWVTGG